MNVSDTQFLGVDVGGTHLKIGLVDRSGTLCEFYKEDTTSYREHGEGFGPNFVNVIGTYLAKFPQVKKVGIGLPGMITSFTAFSPNTLWASSKRKECCG